MNTQISLILGAIIAVALGIDGFFNEWTASIFLGRKLSELIEYIAFWR